MKAITKFLAGGVAIAALASAAPAAAQYSPGYGAPYGNAYPGYGAPYGNAYPGYGYPGNGYGAGGGSIGGYGGGYGYNVPGGSQVAANQCSAAVQQRLGGYRGNGYGYGYGSASGRVLGIDSVEIASGGGYRVRGTAAANGYAYGGGAIRFSCRTDPRGYVVDVDFNNRQYGNENYGNGNYGNGYYGSNYDNPYSVYGYQRY